MLRVLSYRLNHVKFSKQVQFLSTSSHSADHFMPITVLSGFLGAGKTSFLNHALKNQNGLKFGLVVNDMATINIDAKQIRHKSFGSSDGIDTMELQNGCVCCSMAEELIASVSKLVSMSELRNSKYDHIILECSGIAEPRKIRDLFQQAEAYNVDLLKKVRLDTMITVVDASVFFDLFGTNQQIKEHSQLAYNEKDSEMRKNANINDSSEKRQITELLLEQVECADIVLVNKCDLLKRTEDVDLVKKVINSINPSARVIECINGAVVDPLSLAGSAHGKGAAEWGLLDEHRNMVAEAEKNMALATPSHHQHKHSAACGDSQCTDATHDHSHHQHKHSAACGDSQCTDATHDHSHQSHVHGVGNTASTTGESRFGISSFVYKRRRPFHPVRFGAFLNGLGKLSVNGVAEISPAEAARSEMVTPLVRAQNSLLRSKGFVWMGTSSSAAYFMSHAGQYLEIMVLGRWWGDIPRGEWPVGMHADILQDFGGHHGDRRQELVFIGQFGKSAQSSRAQLEMALDDCLLTDPELCEYDAITSSPELGKDDLLKQKFAKK